MAQKGTSYKLTGWPQWAALSQGNRQTATKEDVQCPLPAACIITHTHVPFTRIHHTYQGWWWRWQWCHRRSGLNRNLFFTVLNAKTSKIKMLANVVPGKDPWIWDLALPGSNTQRVLTKCLRKGTFMLWPLSGICSYGAYSHSCRSHLPNPWHSWVRASAQRLWETVTIHSVYSTPTLRQVEFWEVLRELGWAPHGRDSPGQGVCERPWGGMQLYQELEQVYSPLRNWLPEKP